MDLLQEKIRKLKCPIVVDFGIRPDMLPPQVAGDYAGFCKNMLEGLKGAVPAVRFSFDQFALLGPHGLQSLSELLAYARELGFFVLVDGPQILSPWAADRTAEAFFGPESLYPCDGLILSPYIGSDAIRPFLPYCKDQGKSVFFVIRSANKSASQLQDLMTGSRLVHLAAADILNRQGENLYGKCGYSQVGALTAATSGSAVTALRSKYNRMFLLVDGYDYPGGNGKTCSFGFDKFGHGCAVSIGPAILAAWQNEESDGADYLEKARNAVQRIKNNLKSYVTIL